MNLFRQRDEIVDRLSRAWTRETIRYRRQDPVTRAWSEISLLCGFHNPEAIGQYGDQGALINSNELLFSVTAADLNFGAGPVYPLEGDEILTTHVAGESRRYRVTKRDGRPYRFGDEYGISLMIYGEWS